MGMLYDIFDDAAIGFDRDVALRRPISLFERAVNTNWDGHVLYADLAADGERVIWAEAHELSAAGSRRHAKSLSDAAAPVGGGVLMLPAPTEPMPDPERHERARVVFLDDEEALRRHAQLCGADAERAEQAAKTLERSLDSAPSERSRELRRASVERLRTRASAMRDQERGWLEMAAP